MPDEVVQTCITSPPYWGLRDYGTATWKGGDPECAHLTPRSRGDDIKNGEKQERSAGSRPNLVQQCNCGAKRIDQQIGLESTPEEYVAKMVEIFREVRRVLKDDGTLWLNLGDCYAGSGKAQGQKPEHTNMGKPQSERSYDISHWIPVPSGLKPKDLVGIPWRVAFALQADGWYLRSEIIWSKPNPMPESVTDRPSTSHEKIFLLSKSGDPIFWTHPKRRTVRKKPKPDYRWRHKYTGLETNYQPAPPQIIKAFWKRRNLWIGHDYYYDGDAIAEPAQSETTKMPDGWDTGFGAHGTIHRQGREKGKPSVSQRNSFRRSGAVADHILPNQNYAPHRGDREDKQPNGKRNKRSVWTVATQSFPQAHFATFPEKLIEPCILAGCPEGGIILDPFFGRGTVGKRSKELGRQWVGIDLNPEYCKLAADYTSQKELFL